MANKANKGTTGSGAGQEIDQQPEVLAAKKVLATAKGLHTKAENALDVAKKSGRPGAARDRRVGEAEAKAVEKGVKVRQARHALGRVRMAARRQLKKEAAEVEERQRMEAEQGVAEQRRGGDAVDTSSGEQLSSEVAATAKARLIPATPPTSQVPDQSRLAPAEVDRGRRWSVGDLFSSAGFWVAVAVLLAVGSGVFVLWETNREKEAIGKNAKGIAKNAEGIAKNGEGINDIKAMLDGKPIPAPTLVPYGVSSEARVRSGSVPAVPEAPASSLAPRTTFDGLPNPKRTKLPVDAASRLLVELYNRKVGVADRALTEAEEFRRIANILHALGLRVQDLEGREKVLEMVINLLRKSRAASERHWRAAEEILWRLSEGLPIPEKLREMAEVEGSIIDDVKPAPKK